MLIINLLILDIHAETSEEHEHKLDIQKSSYKFILSFVLIGKTSIVNKLKQSEVLKQLVAQFMKDGMDTESIGNHCMSILQNL